MEKHTEIILIASSSVSLLLLSCVLVKFCIIKYRIMEENRRTKTINIIFKKQFQNRINPIDSDDEEMKDEFSENNVRPQELTTNDNKV